MKITANFITTFRLILFFIGVSFLYMNNKILHLLVAPIILIVVLLDAVDGIVARKLKSETQFGAFYDIAADRIVELTVYVVFAQLGYISVLIPLIVMVRGILTGMMRSVGALKKKAPFKLKYTKIGNFLVSSRFMRGGYGGLKVVTFVMLAYLFYLTNHANPANWFVILVDILVYLSALVCVLRGLPVIIEGT